MYVCLRNGGKCSDDGSQPLFFSNGRKDKSICTYPQYECCGYKKCNLYHICSQLKITNRITDEIEKDKVTV